MKGYAVFGDHLMIQVYGAVLARFEACLAAKNISENLRLYSKKWLRSHLDFFSKYRRDANNTESGADFQKKLREKGQTEMQQKQAAHAVSLYFDLLQEDGFIKPSVASPASVIHEAVEVAVIKRPLQDPAREEQQARLVPLDQKISNEVCR